MLADSPLTVAALSVPAIVTVAEKQIPQNQAHP